MSNKEIIEKYLKDHKITLSILANEIQVSISYLSKLKYNNIIPNERVKNSLEELGLYLDYSYVDPIHSVAVDKVKQLTIENNLLKAKINILENLYQSLCVDVCKDALFKFLNKQLKNKRIKGESNNEKE